VALGHGHALAGGRQALGGVKPDGLGQPVAGGRAVGVGQHQRLGDQPREHVEHLVGARSAPAADGLGRLEAEAAGEDRQPPEQPLLRPAQ
jgi:hypothetical protein